MGQLDATQQAPVPPASSSRAFEAVVAAIAVVASVVVLLLSRGIESRVDSGGLSPDWWPLVLGGTGLALSLALLVVALVRPTRERDGVDAATREGWIRAGLAIILSVIFIEVWAAIGFVIPAVVYLAVLALLFGVRSVKLLVLFPLGVTALIYVMFDLLLRVPL
ncbi:tripartite tricarboxylate transporter TctB family protein [Georgenia sp. H159]|uniref:tripartite tricarboxylate transporter TctB family protein n=1 Tax=Georgenia sp. H159 TaxID=3076115 RepID=UPI002D783342|nr:tripartite tricarboxylate transporter TctB family protein [Georgenia sp. H159]